jgi:hypothetical protein
MYEEAASGCAAGRHRRLRTPRARALPGPGIRMGTDLDHVNRSTEQRKALDDHSSR